MRKGRFIKGSVAGEQDPPTWRDPQRPVRATEAELELIRAGIAEAERGELVDARVFFRELQRTP